MTATSSIGQPHHVVLVLALALTTAAAQLDRWRLPNRSYWPFPPADFNYTTYFHLNGSQLYRTCQVATGRRVAQVPLNVTWNMYVGASTDGDPVRDYRNFYAKFVNAYDTTNSEWPPSQGIPIIGSAKVDDGALLRVRDTVVALLQARCWRPNPWDIRDVMVAFHSRVIVKAFGELWSDHPEMGIGDEAGGGSPYLASTGCESDGLCYAENVNWTFRPRSVCVEEYGHSIHEIAIQYLSPADAMLIRKLERLQCARGPHAWRRDREWDPDTAADEYFASGVEFFFDNSNLDQLLPVKNSTQLYQKDPALFCLAAKYYDTTPAYCPIRACRDLGCTECECATEPQGQLPDCPAVLGKLHCSTQPMCSGSSFGSVPHNGSCSPVTNNAHFSCGKRCSGQQYGGQRSQGTPPVWSIWVPVSVGVLGALGLLWAALWYRSRSISFALLREVSDDIDDDHNLADSGQPGVEVEMGTMGRVAIPDNHPS